MLSIEELKHLEEKEGRRTLEEVMMLFYKKPCRRIKPSTDRERGSVIFTKDEVVVVCNPLDFHLWSPEDWYRSEYFKASEDFGVGTCIISEEGKKVSWYLSEDDYKALKKGELQNYPGYRWGSIMLNNTPFPRDQARDFTKQYYDIPGGHCRVITCIEEVQLAGRESGREFLKSFAA